MTSGRADFYHPLFERAFLLPAYWPTWLALALLRLCVYLPRGLVGFIGARLGDLACRLNEKRRRVAQYNVDLCFPELPPEERRRMVRRHFQVYLQCILDMGLVWWARPAFLDRYIRFTGLEHYRQHHERGHPIIVLTGHFAALDIGGIMLSRHFPQLGLIKPEKNRLIDWFISRGRTRFLGRLVTRAQGLRPVVREVKAGRGFYYLPDEDFGPERSVFAPFLGTQAATLTALGRLAKLCDAVVIPCVARRLSAAEGYEIALRPALENFPGGDPLADAARMNRELEIGVRAAPQQYLWTLKLFKTRPGGAPSPY